MIKKVISFLLNKYILSISISLIIISFIPDFFSKHKVELIFEGYHKDSQFYFHDLDNDGNSEKIVCYNNNIGNACYMIYDVHGYLIDQYNFEHPIADDINKTIWFHDIDDNGFKEIYTLTQKQDSIFLNIHETHMDKGIYKTNVFVDLSKKYMGQYDIYTKNNSVINDTSNEFVFGINSGRSITPRKIYKYQLKSNQIFRSPHLTNNGNISEIIDLDNDSKNEVLLNVHASGNSIDSIYSQRSDYSSWLTVLNNDLTFKFKPIEFSSKFSALGVLSIEYNNEPHIICIYRKKNGENECHIYNVQGQLQKKQKIRNGNCRFIRNNIDSGYYLQFHKLGVLEKYDQHFNLIETYYIPKNYHINFINIDANSDLECVLTSDRSNSVTIFSQDFKSKIDFNLPVLNNNRIRMGSLKKNGNTHFFIQKGDTYYVYKYDLNPLHKYQYLIYVGIFLLILLLISLAAKGQKLQEAKKRKMEEQIADLQLKSIKNQVDPHFVFNAVNTISEMTLMDNKLEADQFICEFSDLMRKTLNRSDKITTTLKDELEYVSNYVRLQKIRLNNAFDFIVHIDEKVDSNLAIPKHTIYTYVENAIKYGIHNKTDKAVIKIEVKRSEKQVVITITDNGGGLTKQSDSKISTGKGLRILSSIFDLYSKRFKTKIEHALNNFQDENGQVIGVKAEVKISSKKRN